jgi:FkbM family methyltransferase
MTFGVLRSLLIYYGKPTRQRAMRAHYARFLRNGALAFDIGAHVGNRTRVFRALGAHVIALEPHPRLAALLRRIFRRDPDVAVEQYAVGSEVRTVTLHICDRNPTISTTSEEWAGKIADAPGFSRFRFERTASVPQTTLDELIARFGTPDFVKIDVEGSEDNVLAGLSNPIAALSIEFLPQDRDVALRAIARLERLAPYRFNFSLGETVTLVMRDRWWDGDELRAYLAEIPDDGPSGDIYAEIIPESH